MYKLLTLFLFLFQIGYGQISIVTLIDKDSLPLDYVFSMFDRYDSTNIVYRDLVFTTEYSTVSFKGDLLYLNHNLTDYPTTQINPKVVEIISIVLKKTMTEQYDRYNEAILKVQFYEKYFGKLENIGECAIFTPVADPPKMIECTIKN